MQVVIAEHDLILGHTVLDEVECNVKKKLRVPVPEATLASWLQRRRPCSRTWRCWNSAAALAKIHRLLKPGGFFISSTVCLAEGMWLLRPVIPVLQWLGRAPYVSFVGANPPKQVRVLEGCGSQRSAWQVSNDDWSKWLSGRRLQLGQMPQPANNRRSLAAFVILNQLINCVLRRSGFNCVRFDHA